MNTLVDDVGSYPLPSSISRAAFAEAYIRAREAMINGTDFKENEFIKDNFCEVTINSFKSKITSGLDVVNYPQQYDGIRQVRDAIHIAMANGTFLVEEKQAFLPEVKIIADEAKSLSEEFGKKILLRVSLFGPMEQYLKEIGMMPYTDVLDAFAETIRRFAKNSIIDSKYIKTEVVSIDEPSFGFLSIAAGTDLICEVLEKAFDFAGPAKQIHLHSASRLPDLLEIKNLDVLSFEYAASPKNIESISKDMLEKADKQVRIGVSRTDIDSIVSELFDQGIQKPSNEQLVESEEIIGKRYLQAKEKFGDRLGFSGPDCGVGSWPSQSAANFLLKRTVDAIKKTERSA